MPIMTYGGFRRMTNFCKTFIPDAISDKLEKIKDDDAAIKAYGIDLGVEMCQKLLDKGTPGLHIYSLNMSRSALEILKRLKLIEESKVPRKLPWRASPTAKRCEEMVRPIFWSNRPKSYIKRTEDWDKYACNRSRSVKSFDCWVMFVSRWGDCRSPAYGTLSDYPFMRPHTRNEKRLEKAREAWGESLTCLDDVIQVFIKYTKGKSPPVMFLHQILCRGDFCFALERNGQDAKGDGAHQRCPCETQLCRILDDQLAAASQRRIVQRPVRRLGWPRRVKQTERSFY